MRPLLCWSLGSGLAVKVVDGGYFDWLVWLGDPEPAVPAPGTRIRREWLGALFEDGLRHRVLPSLLRRLRQVAAERGAAGTLETDDADAAGRALAAALEQGNLGCARLVGMAELLRSVQGEILEAFEASKVDAVVLKGTSFADRLYPDPALRPFDDIDLLVGQDALEPARAALAARGLVAVAQTAGRHAGHYAEEKWRHPLLGDSPVELHWNLVNSPKIRRFLSVEHRALAAARDAAGALTPAALLYVAAIHGVTGHGFDRLQQIFDMLQAARGRAGPVDIGELERLAAATGGTLALATGLAIAAQVTGDPAMRALAHAFSPGFRTRGLAWIYGRMPVLTAQNAARSRHAWRRQLCRELLVRLS